MADSRKGHHPKKGTTKSGLHPVSTADALTMAVTGTFPKPPDAKALYVDVTADIEPPDTTAAPETGRLTILAPVSDELPVGIAPSELPAHAPQTHGQPSVPASPPPETLRAAPVAPAAPAPPPAPPPAAVAPPPPPVEPPQPQRQAAAPAAAQPEVGSGLPSQPLLFEVAWEVCWQLGGIYTVIRSKAVQMTKIWGDRYYLIGPYNADTAAVEIEETQPHGPVAQAIENLRSFGIKVHHGRWLITGRPQVILLDFGAAYHRLAEFKYLLWKDHGIQIPENDWEVNNVTVFGFLAGMFLQQLTQAPGVQLPVLAHFHEWMGGLAIMRAKFLNLPVATVFTTHATLLGRYLCTDNPDFYAKLPWINPDQVAGHYNIYARYCIERGAAHCADVFTTVSDITGFEAEKLIGRRPDVITPNGLNIQKFAALHEFQNLHKHYKEVIHQFVAGHFFPSYSFDLDRTIYLFTSGRYEYTNKGYNLFIEALARLNHWLRAGNIPITVVAFIVTKAPYKSINVDVLKSQAMFDELKNVCDKITDEMGEALLHNVSRGRLPERGDLMTEEAVIRLKRGMHAWRTWKQPPIITHDLWDDQNDAILKQLRSCQLFNAKDDPVKVVFHPDFLSATSPLVGLDYDQFVRGCHMGVFPSYYEPWGYTPMECVASGVPAVTSDLAGFGSYVLKNIQDPQANGLFVIGRRYASWDQAAHQLTEVLFNYATRERRSRIEFRNRVERLSEYFDWSNLVSHYSEAHRLALSRKTGVPM